MEHYRIINAISNENNNSFYRSVEFAFKSFKKLPSKMIFVSSSINLAHLKIFFIFHHLRQKRLKIAHSALHGLLDNCPKNDPLFWFIFYSRRF
jgi:hypothetical protein